MPLTIDQNYLVEFSVDVPINAMGILMENFAFAPGFVLFLRIL